MQQKEKTVIARDAAESMILEWCEAFEVDDYAPSEKLIRAVMAGRVDFDEEKETFTVKLRKALHLENGEYLTHIVVREPCASELTKATKGTKDELAMMVNLLSAISGEPVGVIDRIKQRDLEVLGEVYGFFA